LLRIRARIHGAGLPPQSATAGSGGLFRFIEHDALFDLRA
jgi:hypothetical protein